MSADLLTAHLEKGSKEAVRRIQELIRQPSVSPERRGGRACAQLLCELYSNLGCRQVKLVETGDDWPGVWGYFDAGAEHTIASYTYFDTYGVEESQWDYPPFGGVVDSRDSFPRVILGRGATVKGSHVAWVNALAAIASTQGSLPVNVLLLAEGAEMMGSPNFQRICEDASGHLDSVNAFLSPRISENLASREIPVTLGYKNMVTFDVECRGSTWGHGPAHGTIYGNSKSIVDSPTHRVIQAVASLLADDGNTIAVEGLKQAFSTRKELSEEERNLVNGLLRRFSGREWGSVLPTAGGVDKWAGDLEGEAVLLQYLYGPSINVSEIRSAGVGDQPQLTMLLPESAKASVELRMVTDMPAAEIVEHVRQHFVSRGFPEVSVVPYGLWDGLQVSATEPVVKAAVQALESYGRTPVLWPIQPFGGPWAGVAHQLGVSSLSGCSLGYGANGGGGANEYLVVESDGRVAGLAEAERFMCDLLLTYAKTLRR
jgi:acetylornithine deacetylase/succinyl-diaminopimelate desuccinylase-like protein